MILRVHFVLAVLSFLLVHAQDIVQIEPRQLGIQPNSKLLENYDALVYGTIIQFDKMKQLTDGNAVHLAKQAFLGMHDRHQQYNNNDPKGPRWPTKTPKVMTVLVLDNTAYIASSMKGVTSLFYTQQQNGRFVDFIDPQPTGLRQFLIEGLRKCSSAATKEGDTVLGHRNGGQCGEFMALLAFEQMNAGAPLPKRFRMVTVQRVGGEIKIDPPCDAGRQGRSSIGCLQIWKWEGWHDAFFIIPESQAEEPFEVKDADRTVTSLLFA